ncbi:Uncharacterised protein [Anaerobiospirillum thomasii]|uniref:Flagellar assembly protein T N-terminal domain-containing protein n=2 Tax=Gammaproteobacteria TaxID=1236 RepID=A0A2X0WVM9_9GAMM|nr:flagellar assembly protein T N-terminal domain-containing protein [Anaerobiospirillum thomasii]SPT69561.1 Uncharacterised protein [Anaerobiospirillum thomasii]SPT71879.1 Uncharacterised protein [Anaerobiospirillum thomasii]
MRISYLKMALMALPFACINAQASWHTASGIADLASQDIETARQEAINDALRSIVLEAGANINIIQSTDNGTLATDNLEIKSATPIKQVTVLEEQRADNLLTVKVRAFVDDTFRICNFAKVRKTVLPIVFRYEDNEAFQSSTGIEDINKEISNILYKRLAKSQNLNVRPLSNINLRISPTSSAAGIDDSNNLRGAARQNQAQYVIIGSINSMSISGNGDNIFKQFAFKETRRINFNVTVYDTVSDLILLNKSYDAETDWDFDQGEYVDIRSNRFLASPYGQRLRQLSNYAVDDIISALQCAAPSARVIDVEGDDIIINMGRSSGLEKGMEFKLSHTSTITDRQGERYRKFSDQQSSYTVTELYPHSAKLTPKSLESNLVNVMLDDMVMLN